MNTRPISGNNLLTNKYARNRNEWGRKINSHREFKIMEDLVSQIKDFYNDKES